VVFEVGLVFLMIIFFFNFSVEDIMVKSCLFWYNLTFEGIL